jgi:hypothetical protein
MCNTSSQGAADDVDSNVFKSAVCFAHIICLQ